MKQTVAMMGALVLAGCGTPGPSVPMQPGHSLQSARAAVSACAPHAPQGGKNAVVGGYVTGVLLGGILIGPIVVASNEASIRANGEASAVDRCLAQRGFVRRDLTDAEIRALDRASPSGRLALLDHLVGGGQLDTFRGV